MNEDDVTGMGLYTEKKGKKVILFLIYLYVGVRVLVAIPALCFLGFDEMQQCRIKSLVIERCDQGCLSFSLSDTHT